ncbi:OLC1v1002877C1 [Oldenlandia corymbosa var. corymbosa]|uniref:OLC1v1002877C1 n=1 Tax=Oldenlandia corymbosa var. corymbosa TaxID=529605 RepID=A0AAV1D8R7_OLDCO|nr:OLC1v1002877C1 [Oldenlandia corymbosa var. corymbosa]
MKNTKGKKKKQNILIRILKSPLTALQKVTNAYLNSMSSCADRFGENNVLNCSIAPQMSSQLPRNFSVSSSKDTKHEDELKDLIRTVSTKFNNESKIEIKNVDPVQKRSYSVGIGKIGRIDEDAACDFKEEVTTHNVNFYPRSKTYAVPSNRISVRT